MQPLFINEIHIKSIKFNVLYEVQFTSLGYVLRPELRAKPGTGQFQFTSLGYVLRPELAEFYVTC